MKIFKWLLWPFSLLYGLGTSVRNFLFDKNILRGVRFSLPVISVGNLSTGGTGKTPHIEYLIQLLKTDYKLATMSRGYRRETRGFQLADPSTDAAVIGDEPAQIYQKFPDITVSVCEQRMTGIPRLMGLVPEIEIILLDDAFQHRSVKPGLQILLTDYSKPFYRDQLLPLGTLREVRNGYKRADIIIVTKCPETLSAKQQSEIRKRINPFSHQSVFFSTLRYGALRDFFQNREIDLNADIAVLLLCGIARPELLQDYLRPLTAHLELLRYPDHHAFSMADLELVVQRAQALPGTRKMIITTEKDAVRLARYQDTIQSWQIPVGVLPVEIRFMEGAMDFQQRVQEYIFSERND